MSSSEEYLDSLLRAIMEGNTNEEPSPSMVQDVTEAEDEQGTSAPEESDTIVIKDDNEAMFPPMDEETVEDKTQEAVTSSDGMISDELALGDGMLSDELLFDGGTPSDEWELDEATLFDEQVLNEEAVTDELITPDGLTLDDGMLSDELPLGDSMSSDELASDDKAITDDLALIETEMGDFVWEEEPLEESTVTDDLSLDELGLGDLGLEDQVFGEMEQDESEVRDDFGLGDEPEMGDDFALEDATEEGADFALEDAAEGDGDFALEEIEEDDADLSALLASMGADDDLSEINDLLEKSDQGVVVDDDIMAMLGSASGEEEGGDSLDFLSIDGNPEEIREITPEEFDELEESGGRKARKQKKKAEKERKKREKQAKKAKNKNASQDRNVDEEDADDLNSLLGSMDETGDKPKKKGAFSKFIDFLLEEDELEDDDSGRNSDNGGLGSLSEENKEILAELQAEDKKNAKKKDKKEKKAKKDKKGKGGEKKEAKPKKPKKEKVKKEKKKKEKIEEEPQVPEKKLSKKKVVSVFIFCATIAACIGVVTILLPEQLERQEARVAFDQSQYTQVYELLYGKELSEEDEVLMQKSSTILKLQRKLDSYENYVKMDKPLEALDALLDGVSRYQILRNDAELYNVSGEVVEVYGQILDALSYNYGLSEADALDIIASEDDITYSQRVQAVISGDSFGVDEPALPEGRQDVLPEEEEIIDRLEEQLEDEEIIDRLEEQLENEEIIDEL